MNVFAIEGEHEDIVRTANADASYNGELGESRKLLNESMVAEENEFAIASAAYSSSRIASTMPTFSCNRRTLSSIVGRSPQFHRSQNSMDISDKVDKST